MEPASRATGPAVAYPGARAPERTRNVDAFGVRIAVYEWGDAKAPPLLLLHGGFDFARTFDVARAAARGGRLPRDRVGPARARTLAQTRSQLDADVRDAHAVLEATGSAPLAAVGHLEGRGVLCSCAALPGRFALVSIDGILSRRPSADATAPERRLDDRDGVADHRRRTATFVQARHPEGLARAGAHEPAPLLAWLRYLVSVGAQQDPAAGAGASIRCCAGGFGRGVPNGCSSACGSFPCRSR
jgi:pimeloyl-ACP methyl ester carboxylesterase